MRPNSLVCLLLFIMVNAGCFHDKRENETWHVITLEIEGAGTVTGLPDDGRVTDGDSIELYAQPDSGAVFCGWNYRGITAANPLNIRIDSALKIKAIFASQPGSLKHIPSMNRSFLMGSDAPESPAIEKPAHQVLFTYDFYCSEYEVTKEEYYSLMKNKGVSVDSSELELPVTGISWYDAVIYCNEKSKHEGYDTVYTYTSRCPSNGGCPYELENLSINYQRFGYRLPTEAEWEFACRGGATTRYHWGDDPSGGDSYAWNFSNAENRIHPVGTKQPNGFLLYDMSGNAAEWVNDRLGWYAESLYVNPVGSLQQTEEQFMRNGERPIKGGSYRLSDAYLHPSMRKGPYPLTASMTQIDIGFRVVAGAFSPTTGIVASVDKDTGNLNIGCQKSELIALLGTSSIKTVFVYTEKYRSFCMLADFTKSPVQIVRCNDDSSVIAPSISPDGRFVAWCNKGEGAVRDGRITIRSLSEDFTLQSTFDGFLPRWWVSPYSRDTFVVFTDGASQNDLPGWSNEKTLRVKISGGKPAGSPEVVWQRGSYHGGMSSDGRYLGTAFTVAKLVDLQLNDTNIFYFQPPWNGRNDSAPQVCNLSMSPSRANPGEALFLDFGYPERSTVVGRPYNLHEVIFIANTALFSKEHITQWIPVPAEYTQWNYTEFTNYPGAVSAIAQSSSVENNDAIMLINRNTVSMQQVITGKSMRDPVIWINPDELSELEDPYRYFGKYDEPHQTAGQVPLAAKLRLFWHERENVSCIAIGNSPMLYGFDPHSISVLPTLNMGWFQGCIGSSVTIALQYVLPNTPNLKVLIIDLDASYFNVDSRKMPRLSGLYYTKGYELDLSNDFYRTGIPDAVQQKINNLTSDNWDRYDLSGSIIDSIIGEGWGAPIIEGNDYSMEDSIVKVNLTLFSELLDAAQKKNIKVLAINFPQNPKYKETEMAGRAGPKKATFIQLAKHMDSLGVLYPQFIFYDANNFGNHDYIDSEALDANHLNMRGGKKLASRIDSLLQGILK